MRCRCSKVLNHIKSKTKQIVTLALKSSKVNATDTFAKIPAYSLNSNIAQHCDTAGYQPLLMIMESSKTPLHQINYHTIYFSRQGFSLIVQMFQGSIIPLAIEHFSLMK